MSFFVLDFQFHLTCASSAAFSCSIAFTTVARGQARLKRSNCCLLYTSMAATDYERKYKKYQNQTGDIRRGIGMSVFWYNTCLLYTSRCV